MRHLIVWFAGLLVLAPFTPSSLVAQLAVQGRAGALTVGGRFQLQYARSSVDRDGEGESVVDDLFLRRARINVDVRVNDRLDGRLQPDFAGEAELADAWARFTFAPALRVSFGQFKRAFSIFELSSSTDLPIIERDGRIEGVGGCPGVGGVCSFSRLTEKLQFDDRDLGVKAEGRLGERIEYRVTLTNGEGKNSADVNDAKSFSGRLSGAVADGVDVGVFTGFHDLPGEAGGTDYAGAVGADVAVGSFRDGFHLLAALARGENWRVGPEADFTAAQALASVYLPLSGRGVAGVEPLLRASWTSTETRAGATVDALLLTPGILLYVEGKNALGANLDWYDPGDGAARWSLKLQAFLYF